MVVYSNSRSVSGSTKAISLIELMTGTGHGIHHDIINMPLIHVAEGSVLPLDLIGGHAGVIPETKPKAIFVIALRNSKDFLPERLLPNLRMLSHAQIHSSDCGE